jgi:hypothetical protein
MTESVIILEVVTNHAINRLPFADRKDAMKTLNAMEKKLGERFANDPAKRKHRVKALDGEAVFAMSDVQSVRVMDQVAFHKAYDALRDLEGKEQDKQYEKMATMIAVAVRAALGEKE